MATLPFAESLPELAPATRAAETSAGKAFGCCDRYKAATPATCGDAIDVPLIVLVAVFDPSQVPPGGSSTGPTCSGPT